LRNKLRRKNFLDTKNKEQGFSFIEFIIAITLLGITSKLIFPIFTSSINKARQKEATLIVSSMLKSAKSNYGLYAFLPFNMGDLKKFAKFKKCNANQVDINGRLACKNSKSVSVENNEVSFFSPSGNYKVEMSQIFSEEEGSMFLVKANPNGLTFKNEGSAVVGCYSPISGVSLVKEFSGKRNDRGEKSFITCGRTFRDGNGNGGNGNGGNGNGGNGNGVNGNGVNGNGVNGNGVNGNGVNGNGVNGNGVNGNGVNGNGVNGNGVNGNGVNGNGVNGNGVNGNGVNGNGVNGNGVNGNGVNGNGVNGNGVNGNGVNGNGVNGNGVNGNGVNGNGVNGDGGNGNGNGNGNGDEKGDRNISNISEEEIISGDKKNDQMINQTTKIFKSSDEKENIDEQIKEEESEGQPIDSVIPPWFR